jgi:hypothetical protein
MFDRYYAYSFLLGISIGGYTNLFSKVVISGLVLYMVHPDNFNIQRFEPLYDTIYYSTYPYISKIYTFSKNVKLIENPKIEILSSPNILPPLNKKNK